MSFKVEIENLPMLGLCDDYDNENRRGSNDSNLNELDNLRSIIHQSAREGNIKLLRDALDERIDSINYQDIDGMTPLHYASRYGNIDAVDLLLSRRAFPDTKNQDGDTPLHIAAKYKHEPWSDVCLVTDEQGAHIYDYEDSKKHAFVVTEQIIYSLIRYGANINSVNEYQLTPLHYAAMKSNFPAITALLESNADVNAEDANDMTPLLFACVHGSQAVIEKLINAKSDITKKDQRQNTVFHIVAHRGEPEYLRMMVKHCGNDAIKSLKMKNNEGKTPIRLAVEGNHPETLKEILEIETSNSTMWMNRESTLLHFAAGKGYIECLKQLIKYGGDTKKQDSHKHLPLHTAAMMNQLNAVEYLLEDETLDAVDDFGMTPLMIAVSNNSLECVKLLIKKGAQLWVTDNDERTIVFVGAKYNALESVQYILDFIHSQNVQSNLLISQATKRSLRKIENEEKTMVNQTDRDENTPMHIVSSNGYLEMMRLLKDHHANISIVNEDEETALHRAASCGQTGAVRQLLEWDSRLILQKDEMGNSPLHLAAKAGFGGTTRVLLEYGADKEARNSLHETPLMVAVENDRLETTQQLVQKGAVVDDNSDSRSVLHAAAEKGYETIIRFLIQNGSKIDRRDEKGRTALDIACEQNKKEVARALLETDDWKSLMYPNDVIEIGKKNKNGNRIKKRARNTPFRRLLAKFPDLAVLVMDKCVERNKEEHDETQCIAYNFEFIDDTYMILSDDQTQLIGSICPYDDEFKLKKESREYANNYDFIYKNHPLKMMANAEKLSLLSHPLSLALLKHKWNTLGRWVYYFALTIYCIFIISLTQFVRHTKAPYNVQIKNDRYYSAEFFDISQTCPDVKLKTPHPIWKSFIFVFAAAQIGKEFIQLYQRKLHYLYNWENWVEVFIYSTSIITVYDFSECSSSSGVRQNWQWLIAALCIFVGWINLLFMIRKMPRFGIYVVMFVDIVKTFFRFFPVFVLFICAFSTSFYVILQNRPEFSTVFISPLKTMVMMIGEFEFTGIFFGDEELHEEKMFGTAHTVIAYVLFSFFCIIMTILLMNLLVGLAVDDIKGVQEKAEMKRLGMQVDLVLQIEASAFFIRGLRFYAISRYGQYPRGKLDRGALSRFWSQFRKRFGINMNSEDEIDPQYDYESELTSEIRTNMQLQRNQLQMLQENVDVLYEKQIRLESLIKQIAKGLKINIEIED